MGSRRSIRDRASVAKAKRSVAQPLAMAAVAALALASGVIRANTADSVTNGQSDLTASGTYGGGSPSTTSDLEFLPSTVYNPTLFTFGNTTSFNLGIGTLDDLDATQTLSIQNSTTSDIGTITLNGGSNSLSGTPGDLLYVASSGSLNIGGGVGVVNLALASSGNFNIAGVTNISSVISGGFAITKTGSAFLGLSGANTYSGGTTVAGGDLYAFNPTALGTGTVTINAGDYISLWWNTGSSTILNNFVLNGIGTAHTNGSGTLETKASIYGDGGGGGYGTYTLSGTITLDANSDIGGNGGNNLLISGPISSIGNYTLVKDGGNIVTLGNTGNSYSGGTNIAAGTLGFGSGTLGTGNIQFTGGTLLYSTGNTQDVSSIIKSSIASVTVNTNSNNVVFNSPIDASNTAGFTKVGAGTLAFAVPQAYAGATVVNGGTLQLQHRTQGGTPAFANSANPTYSAAASDVLAGLSPISVSNPNYVSADGGGSVTLLTNQSVGSRSTLTNDYVVANYAQITYALNLNSGTGGSSTGYDISKINIYSGWQDNGRSQIITGFLSYSTVANPSVFTIIPNSSTTNGASNSGSQLTAITSANGLLATGVADLSFSFLAQENSYVGYQQLEAIGTATAANVSNILSTSAAVTVTSGSLDLGGTSQTIATLTGAGSIINSAIATPATLTLNPGSGAMNTFSGAIAGGGSPGAISVVMAGAGTQMLSSANTYTGGTAINSGILNFSSGALSIGNISFGGGTLQYAVGNTQDVSANISGSTSAVTIDTNTNNVNFSGLINSTNIAGFNKAGAGTLTFNVAQGYSGSTTISGGVLQLKQPTVVTPALKTALAYNFTAANNNLIAGVTPTITNVYAAQGGNSGLTGNVSLLTDGAVSYRDVNAYAIGGSAESLAYSLGASPTGYDISKVNIYSAWDDAGRSQINLTDIAFETVTNPTTFTVLPASGAVTSSTASTTYLASLTAAGGLLGTGVTAIRFDFGSQENSWVGYSELEVVGIPTGSPILPTTTGINIARGAALDFNGVSQTVASLSDSGLGVGSIGNSASSTPVTLTLNPLSGSNTFSGAIYDTGSGGAISLVKNGGGTQILAGVSTYSGTTTINNGTLKLHAAPVGTAVFTSASTYNYTAANNNLLLGKSPIAFSDALAGSASNNGATGAVTVLTTGVLVGSHTGSYTVGGSYSSSVSAYLTYNLGSATNGYDVSAINLYAGWDDSGRSTITLTDIAFSTAAFPNTFTPLYGSFNYAGGGALNLATLTANSSGAILASNVEDIRFDFGAQEAGFVGYRQLEVVGTPTGASIIPTASPLQIASTGTLDLGGVNQQVNSLAGGGSITNSAAGTTSMLTLGTASSNSFTGVISNGAGTTAVTMSGAGVLTLTGSNTYSGGTTLTNGVLMVNNVAGSGTGTGSVAVNGGRLGGSGSIGNGTGLGKFVSINTGGIISPGTDTNLSDNVTLANVGVFTTGDHIWNGGQYTFKTTLSTNPGQTDYSLTNFGIGGGLTTGAPVQDMLQINGVLDLVQGVKFNLVIDTIGSTAPQSSGASFIIAYANSVNITTSTGTVITSGVTGDVASDFTVTDTALTGNIYDVNVVSDASLGGTGSGYDIVVTTPEPGSLSLLGVAAFGLLRRRRSAR